MTQPWPQQPVKDITRRELATFAGAMAALAGIARVRTGAGQTPEAATTILEELVIDLAGPPESIDPVLAYSAREWSIVHSIYDSPVGFSADGSIEPLAARSFTEVDDLTYEIVLREGLRFHDGSAVTSAAISRAVAYMLESESDPSSLFAGITDVIEVDDLTVLIVSTEPSPWLPAQLAVWLLLIPEGFSTDQAATNPVGSGPYRFEGQDQGDSITLVRNPEYDWGSPKGNPIAERVVYRFVPESATRVADLSTGTSDLITEIASDQLQAVREAGAVAVELPIVGSAFIRIATDVEPFDNPMVRQALNYAVDVQTIADALVSPESNRLASLFPDERSMAFNPDLAPYPYDPERARTLLNDAGVSEGTEVVLEVTTGSRIDVAEAIAAQLSEAGFAITIKVSEYTDFNATWSERSAPALRMVTWRPLYDPHTLLGLVFAKDGFLSRYGNADADDLINAAAGEVDPGARSALYRELSELMRDDAPAVYLWNLTSGYGVGEEASHWQPRGDEYVIPTYIEEAP
jgi:peptide/nickel transport system substrate-binding protein